MLKTTITPLVNSLRVPLVHRHLASFGKKTGILFEAIQAIRKGSKVSRLFRFIFENKNLKKIFGANIALLVMASNLVPANANFNYIEPAMSVTPELILTTQQRGIQLPLNSIKMTQGFKSYHPGVDLDGVTGDPVRAIMSGRVEAILKSKFGYGNAVIINHGDNLISLYAHLSKIEVTDGQEVVLGAEIGKMGSTGHSTGDHLHLEIRQDGKPISPFSLLPKSI